MEEVVNELNQMNAECARKTKVEQVKIDKQKFSTCFNNTHAHFTRQLLEEIERVSFLWLDTLFQRACGFFPVVVFDIDQDSIEELHDLSVIDPVWTRSKIKLLSRHTNTYLDLVLYKEKLILNTGPLKVSDFDLVFDELLWDRTSFYKCVQIEFELSRANSIEKQAWYQIALLCWCRERQQEETIDIPGHVLVKEWSFSDQDARDFLGQQARCLRQVLQYAINCNLFRQPMTRLVNLCRKYPPNETEWIDFILSYLTHKHVSFVLLAFRCMVSMLGIAKSVNLIFGRLYPFGPGTIVKTKIFCNMIWAHVMFSCDMTQPSFDSIPNIDLAQHY